MQPQNHQALYVVTPGERTQPRDGRNQLTQDMHRSGALLGRIVGTLARPAFDGVTRPPAPQPLAHER